MQRYKWWQLQANGEVTTARVDHPPDLAGPHILYPSGQAVHPLYFCEVG